VNVIRSILAPVLTAAIIVPLLSGGLAAAETRHELPSRVKRVLDAYQMDSGSYSVWVQDVDVDSPLLAVNADVARNPASTIKLLTTFLALEDLGPAYTWRTEVYLDGQLKDGRLDGDLYLKGYGDPFLVTERVWLLLRGLRQRGLRDIDGDLVIDNSFFVVAPEDSGAFDGQPYRVYNVTPQAFLINFRAVNFIFRPDPDEQSVQIIADPAPANLEIRNQLQIRERLSRREAVERAAAIRLRPILMTTVSMIVAMVPLLTASGPGAVSRFHIGLTIASGLGIGTLFTLFVVPAVYLLMAREHGKMEKASVATAAG